MIEFKYEAEAKRGEKMPNDLTFAEQLAWKSIELLTERYKAGSVTADGAKAEMLTIRKQFANMASKELYIDRVAKLWLDIELASMKYNKNRTLEDADEMRDIIYGFRRFSKEEQDKLLEQYDE